MNKRVYVIVAMAGLLLGLGGLWSGSAKADFRVNTTTVGYQFSPSVASFADGGSIVVWINYPNWESTAPEGIYAQRYDAAGVKIGGEFRVSTKTKWNTTVAVATFADGGFVVVWYGSLGSGSV